MKKIIVFLLIPVLALMLFSCVPPPQRQARRTDLRHVMTALSLYCEGTPVPADTPLDLWNFYGVDVSGAVQYQARSFAGDGKNTEILLFEAKDKESLAEIRTALQARLDAKRKALQQAAPEQYSLYRESSVVSNGRFIRLIFSADARRLAGLYDSCFDPPEK